MLNYLAKDRLVGGKAAHTPLKLSLQRGNFGRYDGTLRLGPHHRTFLADKVRHRPTVAKMPWTAAAFSFHQMLFNIQ